MAHKPDSPKPSTGASNILEKCAGRQPCFLFALITFDCPTALNLFDCKAKTVTALIAAVGTNHLEQGMKTVVICRKRGFKLSPDSLHGLVVSKRKVILPLGFLRFIFHTCA